MQTKDFGIIQTDSNAGKMKKMNLTTIRQYENRHIHMNKSMDKVPYQYHTGTIIG